ncbi:MAG: flagellar basal body-associated FliL family protein [Pseudomonadota bacterium]
MADKTDNKSGSMFGTIITLAILTGVSMGGGFVFGSMVMKKPAETGKKVQEKAAAEKPHKPKKEGKKVPGKAKAGHIVWEIPPIHATLTEPKGIRVRIEATVLFSKRTKLEREKLTPLIADDFVRFARTLSLAQIESSTGLEYLQSDLLDLVRIRTGGTAKWVALKGLIIE